MGYTSGTAMEDRGLRDIERWRDKIEVRLDNRQVFFLFFGSALVACMLFVLGVIVGKRLESRGRAVSSEIEDPLALLDKVATSTHASQAGLTFPQALFGAPKKLVPADKHAKREARASRSESDTASKEPRLALAAHEGKAEGGKSTASSLVQPGSKQPVSRTTGKPETKQRVTSNAHESSEAKQAKPAKKLAESAAAATGPEGKPAMIPTVAAGSRSKGHFTLQLSSFQDKSEAEAFARKFESERPYLVLSKIPGKGTWYRVRVGDYASSKDALAAKRVFEKKHDVIAYVAQR